MVLFTALSFIVSAHAYAASYGKIVRIRGSKVTVRFRSNPGVAKGDVLTVYKRGRKRRTKKVLGTITVRKVRGKKVYGTLEKEISASTKTFKRGLVLANGRGGLGGGSTAGRGATAPRIIVNPGILYGLATANVFAVTAEGELDGDKSSAAQAIDMLTFGADLALYPGGFISDALAYRIFGFGASYWTGSGTPTAIADTTDGNATETSETAIDANDYTYSHFTADVRVRYANKLSRSFFLSIVGKFVFVDHFSFGEVGFYDAFSAMSLGAEITIQIANIFQMGGSVTFPIVSPTYSAVLRAPVDDSVLESSPAPSTSGLSYNTFIGIHIAMVTIQIHLTADDRSFFDYARYSDGALENGNYFTLQFGAKIGIAF